jgi:hypothetical protein
MTHSLTIFNTRRQLVTSLILGFVLFPIVIYISLHFLNAFYAVIGIILILPTCIICGLISSKRKIEISIDDFRMQFKDSNILLVDIVGYYINRNTPILTQIEIKDIKNNDYRFTSLNFGQKGKDFELFISDFLQKVKVTNKDCEKLSFYDFHQKQYKVFRVWICVDLALVILVNLGFLYLILFQNDHFNWKLLFLNFIFLGMYNFHKNNEKIYKNKSQNRNNN